MPSKWAVVVPTIRPAEFDRFLKAWEPLFAEHEVTVYPVRDEPASWESWPDWVPRRSDMCRSWGFYEAWKNGHEFTLSLDDDVRPARQSDAFEFNPEAGSIIDVFAEYERGFDQTWPCIPYLSVGALTDSGREMRGFPYEGRGARCMVQYGGWDGVLDYDGKTQLAGVPESAQFANAVIPVPRGCAVTTCAMNVAFRTEFTPCMWQLPILSQRHEWGAEAPDMDGWKCHKCGHFVTGAEQSRSDHTLKAAPTCHARYNRWGDIWSGLIQKRVLDARGEVMLVNGRASVLHERASDPARNAEVEAPGMPLNENAWGALHRVSATESIASAYEIVARSLAGDFRYRRGDREYADHFDTCLSQWLALFVHDRAIAA